MSWAKSVQDGLIFGIDVCCVCAHKCNTPLNYCHPILWELTTSTLACTTTKTPMQQETTHNIFKSTIQNAIATRRKNHAFPANMQHSTRMSFKRLDQILHLLTLSHATQAAFSVQTLASQDGTKRWRCHGPDSVQDCLTFGTACVLCQRDAANATQHGLNY